MGPNAVAPPIASAPTVEMEHAERQARQLVQQYSRDPQALELPPYDNGQTPDSLTNFHMRVAKHLNQWREYYTRLRHNNPQAGPNAAMSDKQTEFVNAMTEFVKIALRNKAELRKKPNRPPTATKCLRFLECVCAENYMFIDKTKDPKDNGLNFIYERAAYARSMLENCTKYMSECMTAADDANDANFSEKLMNLFKTYAEFELDEQNNFLEVRNINNHPTMEYFNDKMLYPLRPYKLSPEHVQRLRWRTVLLSFTVIFTAMVAVSIYMRNFDDDTYNALQNKYVREMPADFFTQLGPRVVNATDGQNSLETLFPCVPSHITAECFEELSKQPNVTEQIRALDAMMLLNARSLCVPLTFYGGNFLLWNAEVAPIQMVFYKDGNPVWKITKKIMSYIVLANVTVNSSQTLQQAYDGFQQGLDAWLADDNGVSSLEEMYNMLSIAAFRGTDDQRRENVERMISGRMAFIEACQTINNAQNGEMVVVRMADRSTAPVSDTSLLDVYILPMLEFLARPTLLKCSVCLTHATIAFHQNSATHKVLQYAVPILDSATTATYILASRGFAVGLFGAMGWTGLTRMKSSAKFVYHTSIWLYSNPNFVNWMQWGLATLYIECIILFATQNVPQRKELIRRYSNFMNIGLGAGVVGMTLGGGFGLLNSMMIGQEW